MFFEDGVRWEQGVVDITQEGPPPSHSSLPNGWTYKSFGNYPFFSNIQSNMREREEKKVEAKEGLKGKKG